MAKKTVGLKGGDHGLKHPEPEPKRKKLNSALAENRRGSASSGVRKAAPTAKASKPKRGAGKSAKGGDDGSEFDRRVGHSPSNLKRVQAKEINPRKASKKPGAPHGNKPTNGKHTARRNVKLNQAGMTSMLEDSATGKPSRKSTRRSTNHAKENQLGKRQKRQLHSPEARAARGA